MTASLRARTYTNRRHKRSTFNSAPSATKNTRRSGGSLGRSGVSWQGSVFTFETKEGKVRVSAISCQ